MISLNKQMLKIGLVVFGKQKWYSTPVWAFNLGKEYLKQKDSSLLTCRLNGLEQPDGEDVYDCGCRKT